MKKVLLICVALSVVFSMAIMASASPKATTVNGWVSDSVCGTKGAMAGQEACTQKCLSKGAKMVVVTDDDQKVLTVDNPDALKGHEGHHIAVTGKITGDSIHVDTAKML
jgi:hypothetical protein